MIGINCTKMPAGAAYQKIILIPFAIFSFTFMKKFVCCIILCCALKASAQQIPVWKITDAEKYIDSSKSDVLVINFWATFCKPCVAEIPSFIQITNRYKKEKVRLLLISLDLKSEYPKGIAAFAKKRKFFTSIAWLNETNADYFCPKIDAKWSGSIPATLFVNTKTGYRIFFEEELSAAEFEAALQKALLGIK